MLKTTQVNFDMLTDVVLSYQAFESERCEHASLPGGNCVKEIINSIQTCKRTFEARVG